MSGLPSRAWRLGERDWTRGHGIVLDRSTLPPDDECTDVAAWLAGRFDTLTTAEFRRGGAGGVGPEVSGHGTGPTT